MGGDDCACWSEVVIESVCGVCVQFVQLKEETLFGPSERVSFLYVKLERIFVEQVLSRI